MVTMTLVSYLHGNVLSADVCKANKMFSLSSVEMNQLYVGISECI